ncbi:MAG: sulfatase-like hydrolase/transferase, partial [Pirellulaceae bacterium]|nr:sulfatase-like hydrolase/transferase [Pirellulaceae bacterium]
GCLNPRARTIGHWMRDAGYHTCIAGKWQLYSYDPPDYPGAELRRGKGMHPKDAGFDEYSLWHTGHTERKGPRYADPVILENGKFRSNTRGRYGEDVWVEFIEKFMRRHASSDRPFFVYYPMTLPHWPFVPTPRSKDWGVEEKMHPPLGTSGGDAKYFPDMVSYMDEVVGRVVDAVDDLGLREQTLIIYLSDNGTDRKVLSQTVYGNVLGGKGLTTDAGTHVPLIARWPGRLKQGICNDLVDSTDLLPTLLAAAGKSLPNDVATDGISFFSQLVGESGPKRQWTFCHYDPRPGWDKDRYGTVRYARTKRYKLYGNGRLYDIANDRLETRPIPPVDDTARSKRARGLLKEVLTSMAKKTAK